MLAETIDEMLDELMASEGNPLSVPSTSPLELIDNDPLDQPVEPRVPNGRARVSAGIRRQRSS